MRGASVDILDQLLEMSVTGDMAKYLVLNSASPNNPHNPLGDEENEEG